MGVSDTTEKDWEEHYQKILADAEQKAMCDSCIHKVSVDDIKQIRADMLKEIEEAMYTQCFERNNGEDMQKWDGGNWFRYKLFENVIEQIKEQKK